MTEPFKSVLLPPRPGVCQTCAMDHPPTDPHNQQSLYYQYAFRETHGRWPTWKDAIAHCSPKLKEFWESELRRAGAWSGWEGDTPPGPDGLTPPGENLGAVVEEEP